jgi:hypothetical protein
MTAKRKRKYLLSAFSLLSSVFRSPVKKPLLLVGRPFRFEQRLLGL